MSYRRRRKTAHGLATRAAVVLACADGLADSLDVHVVMDDYSSHKSPMIRSWFALLIEHHNTDTKPFRWVKTADQILASTARFAQRTARDHAVNG